MHRNCSLHKWSKNNKESLRIGKNLVRLLFWAPRIIIRWSFWINCQGYSFKMQKWITEEFPYFYWETFRKWLERFEINMWRDLRGLRWIRKINNRAIKLTGKKSINYVEKRKTFRGNWR